MVGWFGLVGWLVGWFGLVGWLVGWLVWLVGWLVGWFGWLVGLVGWLVWFLVFVRVLKVDALFLLIPGFTNRKHRQM